MIFSKNHEYEIIVTSHLLKIKPFLHIVAVNAISFAIPH